jgi:Uma2 family endonuclease
LLKAAIMAAVVNRLMESQKLGVRFAAETGFGIGSKPDTVRAPDVAFVSKERFEQVGPTEKFWPGDTYSEVQDQAFDWLEAGTRLVVVADPRQRMVTVYRSLKEIEALTSRDTLDGGELVPGWRLPIAALFG